VYYFVYIVSMDVYKVSYSQNPITYHSQQSGKGTRR